MAPAIRRALAESEGGLLAFLPGIAEIERTATARPAAPASPPPPALKPRPAAQRARRALSAGRRKLVLATSIARHLPRRSLIGVDSGLPRPRWTAPPPHPAGHRARQQARSPRAPPGAGAASAGRVYRPWEDAALKACRLRSARNPRIDLGAAARLRDRAKATARLALARSRPPRARRRRKRLRSLARSTRRPPDAPRRAIAGPPLPRASPYADQAGNARLAETPPRRRLFGRARRQRSDLGFASAAGEREGQRAARRARPAGLACSVGKDRAISPCVALAFPTVSRSAATLGEAG